MKFTTHVLLLSFVLVGIFAQAPLAYATPVDPCPYVAKAGRTIVLFPLNLADDREERIVSDIVGFPAYSYKTANVSTSLSAGTYDVSVFSADAGIDRASLSVPELKERFFVIVKNGAAEVAQTNSTDDLADGVNNVSASKVVNVNLVLAQSANAILAYHSNYPDASSANSVVPVCAAFDLKSSPVVPASVTPSPTPSPQSVTPPPPATPSQPPVVAPPTTPPTTPNTPPTIYSSGPGAPPVIAPVPQLPVAGYAPGEYKFPWSLLISATSSLILISVVLCKCRV